ncbi:MAG: NAD(+)/NADH kinase, partial [Bacillota bacterium]|nr:NAD(+)/NADH kinase [Bacillota bacterium]
MKRFETVVRFDETSNNINDYIKETLLNNGYFYDEINSEIIIVIGGDGTFLKAVHNNIDRLDEVSFYGIHTGTLGFFTDYKSDEVEEFVYDLINKKPILREYQLLKVKVDNNDVYYALNEMRIENVVRTQVLNVTLNGEEFETFRGTGMCVSTQLGSTAYNRSLKGAVIQ